MTVHWDGGKAKKCPRCKKHYIGHSALSRKDNETNICSPCGTAEALEDYFKNIKEEK